jgi:hypothetical protein
MMAMTTSNSIRVKPGRRRFGRMGALRRKRNKGIAESAREDDRGQNYLTRKAAQAERAPGDLDHLTNV